MPLPTAPSTSNPTTFETDVDNFLGAMPQFEEDMNAAEAAVAANAATASTAASTATTKAAEAAASALTALNAPGTNATSTTSISVGTGSKTITIQADKTIVATMAVKIASSASPSNWMMGEVVSYNSSTGSLVTTISSSNGSGTIASWIVTIYPPYLDRATLGAAASGANSDITSLAALSTPLSVAQGGTGSATGVVLRSYLTGMTMSTSGSSTTMSIAAGQASNSTNAVMMSLSAIAKTTSSWAVGTATGGLDTGTIANSTWYYFYAIRRPDTGVVDAIFSTSSSAPTLPANYTQYRYIGAGFTNGSAQWTAFTQVGREFYWSTPVLDFSAAGATTASLLTCSVPLGRKMKTFLAVGGISGGTGGNGTYLSDPSNADLAPSNSAAPLMTFFVTADPGSEHATGQATCWTNTSAQIRHREWNTSTLYIATLGWTDLADSQL